MFRLAPLVVLLAAQNAQAQQIRSVPHPHKSIGQAVHIANNGDIIEVAPGDYTESLTVTHKTITIRGTGARPRTASPRTAARSWSTSPAARSPSKASPWTATAAGECT